MKNSEWNAIVEKSFANSDFKKRLMVDPRAALIE